MSGQFHHAACDWAAAVSPDATTVAFVSDRGGAPAAWLRPVAGGQATGLPAGGHPVSGLRWSPDGGWFAVTLAPGGAPRTEVWLVRPDGSGLHQVAGFGATTAAVARWLPATGELALTEQDTTARAVLVTPGSGQRRVLAEGDLLTLLDVSADGRRMLLRRGPRSARYLVAVAVDDPTDQIRLLPGAGNTDEARFTADGTAVLARSDVGTELARLVLVALWRPGRATVLAGRLGAEVEHVELSDACDVAAVLWNVYGGTSEVTLLRLLPDGSMRRGPEGHRPVSGFPGCVVHDCGLSAGGQLLALTVEGPTLPRTTWCHDLTTDTPVGAGVAPLPEASCAPFSPVDLQVRVDVGRVGSAGLSGPELHRLRAADGLAVTGWLYRPGGAGPYPTVVVLHGGPEAQERPGYGPLFGALVARGIAVFAPNVRGSSGFGRTFGNADNGAARTAAIADVAACVAYLVDTGIAEPGRIGCAGRSYGGYLTLAALVAHPELFAVGIDVCGMSDLTTFYAHTEPWIAASAVSKYGHPERDRELLVELSPLRRIERLTAPLLVVHGGNDSNVPVNESEQLVAELRRLDRTHRYLCFPDEGHEVLGRINREILIDTVVDWLCHHLAEARVPAAW